MKRNERALITFVLAVIFIAGGCKKSSESTAPTTDPTGARQRVSQANQIFIPKLALLIASQSYDTAAFDFSAATSLYLEAISKDPTNLDAHFGVAMTEFLSLGSDLEIQALVRNLSGQPNPSGIFKGQLFLRLNSSESFFSERPLQILGRPSTMMGLKPYGKIQAALTAHPFSYYQDLIESRLLPVTRDAISHLTVVAADPTYAFYITPSELGGNVTDSVRLDLSEIDLLLGAIQFITADAEMLDAYNVDLDNTSAAAVIQAFGLTSPFLALRANGASNLGDAKVNYLGMASNVQQGIVLFMNQTTHPGVPLLVHNPNDDPKFMTVYRTLDSVTNVLTHPHAILRGPTVNLGNLFDSPIANFKQKLPPYTPDAQFGISGKYDPVLIWTATTFNDWIFPDPEFNGLFPGMSDAGLKDYLTLTSAYWTQRTVLGN